MKRFEDLRKSVLADGIIDADEVSMLRKILYEDGIIDREEADFLFELNDVVSGKKNDPSWNSFFVEAITDHLVKDEISTGIVDADEAKWLIEKIKGDGKIDDIELALIKNLKAKAKKIDQSVLDLL